MVKSNGIVEYIRERFADLEDPAEIKKALVSVLATLMDEDKIDFVPSESKAGYVDDMCLANGGTIADVDEAIRAVKDERPKKPAALVPTLRGKYAQGLREPIDNVTNKVFDRMPLDTKQVVTAISKEVAGEKGERFVTIVLQNNERIQAATRELNAEDRRVFTAICNLINDSDGIPPKVSPIQLYRLANLMPNANPKPEQLAHQEESIAKMASIFIELDTSAIFDIYPNLKRMKDRANFIEVVRWAERLDESGETFNYYEFGRDLPILFQYALTLNQMTLLQPRKPSALDRGISRTADNQEIVQLIATRINTLEGMRKAGKRAFPNMRKIPFQSFYDRANFSKCKSAQAVTNKQNRLKNAVRKQLSFLKQNGIIDSFNDLGDGVEIFLVGEV